MPIWEWIVGKITREVIKAGGEIAKTATEIPKNIMETKKAHREIEELDAKRRERERLITPATFEDMQRYHPKTRSIILAGLSASAAPAPSRSRLPALAILALGAIVGIGIVWALFELLRRLFR